MLPPPMIRDWACRLIASEIDADSPSTQTEGATLRVYEKLRRQFCAPVGADAFQALVSRALAANGRLRRLDEAEDSLSIVEDGEVGITLIAQMLRLFITLLGEAATVRLIEDASLRLGAKVELDTAASGMRATGSNYLGPFRDILLEADQLRHVSERLETLTDTYADIDELMGVAGNIRNIATVLDVFTLIRSKAGGSPDSVLLPPTNGYLN